MAIISPSAIVTEIRGKVGDVVFSRNASGPYVRAYVSPVQPGSAGQLTYLDNTNLNVDAWRNLTDLQKSQWNKFSRKHPYQDALGNRRTYTGYQLFCKNNWWNRRLGFAQILEPKTPRTFRPFVYTVTWGNSNNQVVNLSNPSQVPDMRLIIFATRQVLASKKKFFRPDYRYITTFNATASGSFSINVVYKAVFPGNYVEGNRIGFWVRLLDIQTGFMSKGYYWDNIIDFP